MIRKLGLTIISALLSATLAAQSSREDISQNIFRSGSNYLAYPAPEKPLTKAPKGKKPFYISHYGRHGSRYLIDGNDYYKTVDLLKKADRYGKLTETGRQTIGHLMLMQAESQNRYGELTELGAQQHRDIAHRMYQRFPEVFKGNVTVDAKSTVVIRCILSMENELQELARLNPKLNIVHDASEHDMYYMNFNDKYTTAKRHNADTDAYRKAWDEEHLKPQHLMQTLFNDQQYVKDSVNAVGLYTRLFKLASIVQNSEVRHQLSLYDLFTDEDIYTLWQKHNIGWFMEYGSNSMNGGTQPFTQRNLLRRIIHEADSCLMIDRPGATLRFGHETMVLPLTCLLNLNGYGNTMHPDQLEQNHWYNYRIFPMGCNIQFIFYRSSPKDKDIWVKVLLNEEEATLPIKPVEGPYYRWNDVRDYYLTKLNSYENSSQLPTHNP